MVMFAIATDAVSIIGIYVADDGMITVAPVPGTPTGFQLFPVFQELSLPGSPPAHVLKLPEPAMFQFILFPPSKLSAAAISFAGAAAIL